MSKQQEFSAFPVSDPEGGSSMYEGSGLTKREYFAIRILHANLCNPALHVEGWSNKTILKSSINMADAFMKTLENTPRS